MISIKEMLITVLQKADRSILRLHEGCTIQQGKRAPVTRIGFYFQTKHRFLKQPKATTACFIVFDVFMKEINHLRVLILIKKV